MKFDLEAEENALERERIRVRLMSAEYVAMEEARERRARRSKRRARFAAP